MSLYACGYGHVCAHCETVNQWEQPADFQSGMRTPWAKCYACGKPTMTVGNRGIAPSEFHQEHREFMWDGEDPDPGYDILGIQPKTDFDPTMLLEDRSDYEHILWYPRDAHLRWG